jgi:hypothetical protein
MEHRLRSTHEMAELFEDSEPVRKLVKEFSRQFFQMAHSEGFDPRSIEFEGMVPVGEPDKVVLTLQKASYLTEPITETPPNIQSASYQLVRRIRSFYSSFLAENGWVEGFVEVCPGFCSCVLVLMDYVLERVKSRKALTHFDIDCGDNVAGDLVFFVHLY